MEKYESLYIHIPFCKNKCHYCAFYSKIDASPKDQDMFTRKVKTDIKDNKFFCAPLKSIFIGGGTPSLLPEKHLKELFDIIKKELPLRRDTEITIEANPDTLTDKKIKFLASLPINRISIGIQSFSPKHRKTIGRKAPTTNIKRKMNELIKYGLRNINIDLIYNIPGQTLSDWKKDLEKACDLPISHLSAYELTFEEASILSNSKKQYLQDERTTIKMWKLTEKILPKKLGIKRYEISNYAKKRSKCIHNFIFWNGATYLGLGPSSVSFNGEKRIKQPEDFNKWLQGNYQTIEKISPDKRARELFMLNLRTVKGVDILSFKNRTGVDPLKKFKKVLTEFEALGLLKITSKNIRCSTKGMLVCDQIAQEII